VSIINNILSSIAGSGADFVMDTGDTGQTHVASFAPTYHAQNQSDANERYSLVRNYFENISLPVYLSLGNHDAENGWGAEGTNSHSEDLYTWSLNARLDYWPGPTDQTYSYGGGPYENYYAFDWGDATFIILDSYRYNTVAPVTGDDWVLGDEQMAWLEETLSVSDKKLKFLFAHHILGCYDPDTSHGYNYGDGGGNYSWKGDQANINYLMEKYNAQFYLYGHVHRFVHDWANWSSFNRINQVNYIANMGGSWGGSFVCGGGKRQTIYQEGDCNRGYIKVDVSPYNVTFFFINGSNEALLYNYTISNTAPTVSLVSPIGEVTYGDFTFDYQDAEYDNGKDCTLYIDDLPRIIEHGTRAGVDTTFTFTDLIEGSYHNWSVNCSDGAFSSVSETKRFMYMVDRTISPTYSPTLTELIEGYEEDLKEDQSIIFEVNGKKHSLKLEKISGDEVTITISSDPQTFNMTINETKKVNVNEDNYYDLKIFLKDIRGSFVDLTVQTIHEEILVEEQEEREENKVEKSKLWYWLIVGAVVLIIAGIIVYLTNYKKKSK